MTKKKKSFVPGSTKVLLALTSLAGTVGLWNVISNQSLAAAQEASKYVNAPVDLSPMPTVVPLVKVTLPSPKQEANTGNQTANLRTVSPQQVNPPANLSGAVSAPAVIPAQVTTTGPSK